MMGILEVSNVTKSFGGITAVDGCTMEIEEGIIAGLIGPNAAGKTTLFNIVTGFHKPDSGKVMFGGKDITGLPPYEISNEGIVRSFQIMRVLTRMTVLENLMLANEGQMGEKMWNPFLKSSEVRKEEEDIEEKAVEVLKMLDMEDMKEEYAGTLSGGQRRLLELGRCLMTSPKMLLLDEPTGGVNPSLAKDILDHLNYLNNQGLTILVVEHNIRTVMELSHTVFVMSDGKKIAEGSPEEVKEDERVIDAYLGG